MSYYISKTWLVPFFKIKAIDLHRKAIILDGEKLLPPDILMFGPENEWDSFLADYKEWILNQ